jgi:NTP pyrophosphatase (non-canonical NTP hydrolase)
MNNGLLPSGVLMSERGAARERISNTKDAWIAYRRTIKRRRGELLQAKQQLDSQVVKSTKRQLTERDGKTHTINVLFSTAAGIYEGAAVHRKGFKLADLSFAEDIEYLSDEVDELDEALASIDHSDADADHAVEELADVLNIVTFIAVRMKKHFDAKGVHGFNMSNVIAMGLRKLDMRFTFPSNKEQE